MEKTTDYIQKQLEKHYADDDVFHKSVLKTFETIKTDMAEVKVYLKIITEQSSGLNKRIEKVEERANSVEKDQVQLTSYISRFLEKDNETKKMVNQLREDLSGDIKSIKDSLQDKDKTKRNFWMGIGEKVVWACLSGLVALLALLAMQTKLVNLNPQNDEIAQLEQEFAQFRQDIQEGNFVLEEVE